MLSALLAGRLRGLGELRCSLCGRGILVAISVGGQVEDAYICRVSFC